MGLCGGVDDDTLCGLAHERSLENLKLGRGFGGVEPLGVVAEWAEAD